MVSSSWPLEVLLMAHVSKSLCVSPCNAPIIWECEAYQWVRPAQGWVRGWPNEKSCGSRWGDPDGSWHVLTCRMYDPCGYFMGGVGSWITAIRGYHG